MRCSEAKNGTAERGLARRALRELEWTATRRYVELLREAGDLLRVDDLDFDLRELVDRRFSCDGSGCIRTRRGKPVIGDSCCARYRVELTSLDRARLIQALPLARRRLPADHPLQDERTLPWVIDEDYRAVMAEDERGVCTFVLFEEGRSLCALHDACVRGGLDPWEYKPIACSLWPVATVAYEADEGTRTLVTAYGARTAGLFEDEEGGRPPWCLRDGSPELPRLYESSRGILVRLFGEETVRLLDEEARRRQGKKGAGLAPGPTASASSSAPAA